ncbi:MAG TPA: glycosyltransferase family 2 protein [Streptosporangiaceae bacterium]|nr:glycosyltransferase family 2 protein [Streptosporangiaceae bacterium]
MEQSPDSASAAAPSPAGFPPVSVVMPVRNEERHLAEACRHVLEQDYPGEIELVLAVGPSRDRTLSIAERLAAENPHVTVVPNPTGKIPSGMNAAIKVARFGVITRVDGHGLLPAGYLRTAVRALEETGAADVGGVMAAEGVTPFEQAVAWAMTSKAGVGGASFHTGGEPGPADSVYLGVYRREAIEKAGAYDEDYLRAEDWELNYRIRRNGGLIWFCPDLRVTYRPRSTPRALAGQYFHYGRWRRVVARQHADTINLRYLAPPAAVSVIAAGSLAGLAGLAAMAAGAPAGLGWLTLGLVVPVTYLAGITAVAAAAARRLPPGIRARVPLALATMHLFWGAGFLTSPRGLLRGRNRPPRAKRAPVEQVGERAAGR